jgi:hypothetical protein
VKVGLHANICEQSTSHIADALQEPFETLALDLSGEYGGVIEHLWIDFELSPTLSDERGPYRFRFQKKVGGKTPDKLTGLPRVVHENVGHYSVRPDFHELLSVSHESVVSYVLNLVYDSTAVLIDKQKRLGGFDAQKFRSRFLTACRARGYHIHGASNAA